MRRDFRRIAIVNRGEPAVRFIHAAVEWGREHGERLHTIALFTEPDRQALFVREADESFDLGPATYVSASGERKSSYLDLGRLERALARTRAEAVWPGWGFVAEQPEFAELCQRLGVVFIGPSAYSMRILGDKIAAKRLAEEAGVPVAPWSGAVVPSVEEALAQAESLGYPLLVKAAFGGGGRGIRRVDCADAMGPAFGAAGAEALAAFGSAAVYLERLIDASRHVEVQVVADTYGSIWTVGIRDCTVQRRKQKLVEEAPPPWLPDKVAAALRGAALRMARAVRYRSAGTFEFLFDPRASAFWFMEANTRLQVEHAVTEATTLLDLVKLQLHVARGGALDGEPPATRGHAIEVRLNAEDPDNGFAPSPGTIAMLRLPAGPGVRVDSGVQEGDVVPAEFDSMIAKLVACGRDRREAISRLLRALAQTRIVLRGGSINKGLLMEVVAHPDFAAATFDVGWLDRLLAGRTPQRRRHAEMALLRAALDAYEEEMQVDKARFLSSSARGRPEVGAEQGRRIELCHHGQTYRLDVRRLEPQRYRVTLDGCTVEAVVERLCGAPLRERRALAAQWRLRCGGTAVRTASVCQGLARVVEVEGIPHVFSRDHVGLVRSPSPAIVTSIAVKDGDEVAAGDRLLMLEAMKMETAVLAPSAARVREVLVTSNVQVGPGTPLVVLEAAEVPHDSASGDRLQLLALARRPQGGRAARREAPRVRADLRRLLLGFDADPSELKPLIERWKALDGGGPRALRAEARLLEAFVDACALFRGPRRDDDERDDARGSSEEHLFSYLRDLGAEGAGLPEGFRQRLRRALGHYGIRDLARTAELEDSLFRICRSHQQEDANAAVAFALLERWLQRPAGELAAAGLDRCADLLDRTVEATRARHPALHDLAREVRYRHFERPLLERAREEVYARVEEHLARLQEAPDGERARRIAELVDCPQPLAGLLSSRFQEAAGGLREAILEVLMRRYYRIRDLREVRTLVVSGRSLAHGQYDHEGRRVHAFAVHANEQRLAEAARVVRSLLVDVPAAHDVALDFHLWRREGLAGDDATSEALRAVLTAAEFPRPIRRVVVSLAGPGVERRAGAMQHFTFRQQEGSYVEERFHRGVHPMMAKRLQMGRLAHFDLERLPSAEDVYVLRGRARGNPRDERLFVMAEVRDVTPVRDETGAIVQLPGLERTLLEALAGIRRVQARRSPGQRLHGNRVLLYVLPPCDFRLEEVETVIHRLAPATEGLGLEAVELALRLRDGGGTVAEKRVEVGNPGGRGTVMTISEPTVEPILPLGEYELKVVRLAQRGLTYPYEIVRMLTPPRAGARSDFPPGDFVEYDLDQGLRLVPVERPHGTNHANVVVGLVRNFTDTYPEGMTRVLLLGDPSRDLGALAEPECRRILAALDLAERLRVPVDWLALSAGALISMQSGTENMDWIARVLRRLVRFTQQGGEVNVVVNGINVGAQPYWNAEATMLMHTRGILVMMPDSAMVLTGKRALDYSGGVSAEDNQGIGGYERIMGPNGQAQYFALDLAEACQILLRHHERTYVAAGERFPRRARSADPAHRDVCAFPYPRAEEGFGRVGDVFSDETNPGRKKPFDVRAVMAAVADQDRAPLERWARWRDAETAVVWDAHLGGRPVCLVGIESRPLPRFGFVPADGPDQWTAGTLFPQSSRKLARALNAASGSRPAVVLANLTGFDGSPESLRLWQLEYGAEIGRAVVNFDGPLVFCVISRYHGGAFVVFSNALNDGLQVLALEGTHASVIGGAPAAAVVFAREVDRRVAEDPEVRALEQRAGEARAAGKARLDADLERLVRTVHSRKLGEVAEEFDAVHSVQRALRVGSVHAIIPPSQLRPRLIEAIERGIADALERQRAAGGEVLLAR